MVCNNSHVAGMGTAAGGKVCLTELKTYTVTDGDSRMTNALLLLLCE